MKRKNKIIAGIIAFILMGLILWFANGFVGNPISKFLANRSAKRYIEETYPEMDLKINKATYNFKTGGYNVFVELPGSLDIHFSLNISPSGKVKWDGYEDYVIGKFNTRQRINSEYRKMVEEIFGAEDFPFESDIDFGEIVLERGSHENFGPIYGLGLDELEIDKLYDINELGKRAGHLIYYTIDEELDAKRASQILIHIKEIFDEKSLPFYAIDLTLQEEEIGRDRKYFSVSGFLYEDIYEEGLIKRLEKASKDLEDYYKMEDSKKEDEIKEFNKDN